MEKRKKERVDDEVKFLKKKSKAQLIFCTSPKRTNPKGKDCLQETKESFSNKSVIRRSVSSGKKQKENLQRCGSTTGFQSKSKINTRYLTQTLPTKSSKNQKKLTKSSLISPERVTFNDVFSRSVKDRLSLNDSKKQRNPQSIKGGSTIEEISLNQLEEARRNIQCTIKRVCLKQSISKKDLLKITNQYEKLITRIVLSEVIGNQNKQDQSFPSENQQSLTFRVQENPKIKQSCPGLQLKNIKALKIDDYHDEFMAHYDELSQSWKRDIEVQKRY